MDDHFNKTHLENCGFQLPCTDETSVLDLGYDTYTDNLGQNYTRLPFPGCAPRVPGSERKQCIFSIACKLCNTYEKRSFADAIQMDTYLMLEPQEKCGQRKPPVHISFY